MGYNYSDNLKVNKPGATLSTRHAQARFAERLADGPDHMVEHGRGESRINTDPERVIHNAISVCQVAHHAPGTAFVGWLDQ